ncbi:hypothetical protein ABZY06_33820 [Streptomyces sp. NPDC006540]
MIAQRKYRIKKCGHVWVVFVPDGRIGRISSSFSGALRAIGGAA